MAYIGSKNVADVLIGGLNRLDYRGYDSAGVAIFSELLYVQKSEGSISKLSAKMNDAPIGDGIGIAHTRWATHGVPTETNAHPHSCCKREIWIVHNGIIENYRELRSELTAMGHIFLSQTDSEVIAHLIECYYNGDLLHAVNMATEQLRGSYAFVVLYAGDRNKLIAVKKKSPLIIGIGDTDFFISSDVSAIVEHTSSVIYLEDGDIAEINLAEDILVINDGVEVYRNVHKANLVVGDIEKGDFSHYMIKEIFEQPKVVRMNIAECINSGGIGFPSLEALLSGREIKRVYIVACGTAYFAGMVGEMYLEELAELPTKTITASEFRYRRQIMDSETLVIIISQSGETADTLSALIEAKASGAITLAIVNTVGSTIAREADAVIYNNIGPEIAVASTKAFLSQVVITCFVAIFLTPRYTRDVIEEYLVQEIQLLPDKIETILCQREGIKAMAEKYFESPNFLFLGRKFNYPIALESALKLKEVSYIHAEGMATGEMKHGTIALIDENFPVMFFVPNDGNFDKNQSSIEEIKARQGKIIIVTSEEKRGFFSSDDDVIYLPEIAEPLYPLLCIIVGQLFAYYMATLRGINPDRPRNLAKSVTVE